MPANKILIVDDSPTTAELMKYHLIDLGYEVIAIAATAEEALELTGHNRPNLVLMDIYLGEGMDGIDAADILMHKHNIPVIYVTSYSDDATLERAKLSMPFGFINKPIRDNDLRVNIEIALSRKNVANVETGIESGDETAGKDLREYSLLSEALDHLVSGIIAIDEDMQVFFNNKAARTIFAEGFPVRVKDNTLVFTNPRVKKRFREQLDKKTNVVFSLNYKDGEMHVLIFPLKTTTGPGTGDKISSILFLFNTVRDSEKIEDVVRTIYKLSPTEAKIASRLVFNPYLSDICASLGITYNTGRTHLKRIYQKTDTNKLPALIQKIITGPAGLLIHSND